ncbi:MAG: hypothetical protein ACUVTM_03715 [Candidatus Bathyarchaeia archaeon]
MNREQTLKRLFFLLVVTLLATGNMHGALAAPQLILTVSMNVQHLEKENVVAITVTGKVLDSSNNPVYAAAISTQLTDPRGNSLHIALIYSKKDGSYIDEFNIYGTPIAGNYTLHLTASKPGFDDRSIHFPFTLVAGAFNIKITPTSRVLKQGSNASFDIAILPTQGTILPPINMRVIGLPQRITYNLLSKSAATPRIYTLTLITYKDTPAGSYNFTVIGESKGFSYTAWAILQVEVEQQTIPIPIPTPQAQADNFTLTIIAIIIVVVAFILLLTYRRWGGYRVLGGVKEFFRPTHDREYLAIARALARLEELRATDKIDEETYGKLRLEYEEKLKRTRGSRS